jgi:short-subunit dehydrogenase
VLITGASAGLGRAVAEELAARGDRLVMVARRADRLEELAASLRARGGEAHAVADDLSDPGAPARVVEAAVERLGGLDVLVNNAGIGLPRLFGESEVEELGEQVAVNLAAPILLARLALPHLIASRGLIVNVGSAISVLANPALGVYGTTKAGLAYFTDSLRREVRHKGVRVSLVEPGPVETEFFAAVTARVRDGAKALGASPPSDPLYNPIRDRPPRLLSTDARDAGRRIARLIDRPRRRLSFPRRTVWPWRLIGAFFRLFPGLADLAISGMVARIDRERSRSEARDKR